MKFWKTFLAGLLAFVAGNVLMFFLGLFILIGIIASIASEEPVRIANHSILRIDFSEDMMDSPGTMPFANVDFATLTAIPQVTLLNALQAIEAAKNDPRIDGIYLRPNGGGAVSYTILEELREALADFRESGKFILAYNEAYGQTGYYFVSVADEVYMEPNGTMGWVGMSATTTFYKGLFDKLDIRPEIFRPTACKYKSAVEPYILTEMSDENRAQMTALMSDLWREQVSKVAAAREIDPAALNDMADRLDAMLPEDVLSKGLVDGLIYEDQMADVFTAHGATAKHDGTFEFVTLGQYASQLRPDVGNFSAPQVAIVYAEGEIVDGEGYGDRIFGNSLATRLAEVRRDEAVKAVVVRVNSPGGSALASDVIWREMELLKAEKPVVVSMGQYAASGGYYIAAGADAIVADRMTLTGSIGVFGMFLRVDEALRNKLGVTFDTAKTNPSADMGTMRPITGNERAITMRLIDKIYDTFTSIVAEGRNLPKERVLELAQGRVWSGTSAVELGLADANGGLRTAIAIAVDKAGLGDGYRVVEHTDTPVGLAAFFTGLSAKIRADIAADELGPLYSEWQRMRRAVQMSGILTYCPYTIEME